MTYNKPEVVQMTNALNAIQNVDKTRQIFPDFIHPELLATAGAYQSDE